MKQKIKKIVEKIAVKAAKMQVDSTCKWITYQPKENEAIKTRRENKKKKRLLAVILFGVFCIGIALNLVYADNSYSEIIEENKIKVLIGDEVDHAKIKQIKQEMNALEFCIKDISNIKEIKSGNKNEYIMEYNGIYETIILTEVGNDKVSFKVTDGEKSDSCTVTSVGDVFINGNKVLFSNVVLEYK